MKRSIKNQLFKTLQLAHENDDSIPEVDVDSIEIDPDMDEGESSVAEAVDDVAAGQTIDDVEDQTTDLEDAAETLDELDVAVENYRAAGGKLSTLEAAALSKTINNAVRRYVPDTSFIVGANESYAKDAVEATRLAHENLKETAKSWGEGIVAGAKKAIETLKRIIGDFINRFRSIEQRGARVIKAAEKFQGGGQTIDMDKTKIAVGDDASVEAVQHGIEALVTTCGRLDTYVEKTLRTFAAEENPHDDGSVIEATNKTLTEIFENTFIADRPFPGNYRVELNVEDGTLSTPVVKHGDVKVDGDVTGLDAQGVVQLAKTVLAARKAVGEGKSLVSRLASATDKITASGFIENDQHRRVVNEMSETEKGGGTAERWNMTKVLLKYLTREAIFLGKFWEMTNTIFGNSLEYCEKSLSAKAPEAKKEDTGSAQSMSGGALATT